MIPVAVIFLSSLINEPKYVPEKPIVRKEILKKKKRSRKAKHQ